MPSLASLQRTARQLLGISAYTPTQPLMAAPSDDYVEDVRRALGGQLQPILPTQTRWYMADLEAAAIQADRGDMSKIGRLCRSMRRDGMVSGLMGTRTSGLVALPKRFVGAEKIIGELTSETASRSLFDEMFPPSELALLAADGIGVGVGIAELVPVEGREHPVMVRLEPEWLVYRPNESRWYYNSVAGPLPITPGDGRWILHTPGGTLNPWTYGSWHALGRAYILKDHAIMARANYGAKLANPARVAVAPPAASEEQRLGFLSKLMAWGLNSVFALPMGWDVKLLESNGRGWQVFRDETESANLEIMIELAGQVVTVTGGTGFANADIHKTIRADLIAQTGRSLAHTINTQGIPPYVYRVHGQKALAESPRVSWQTDPPEDLKASADAADAFGRGVASANSALRSYGKEIDVEVLAARHGLPVRDLVASDADTDIPKIELAPTDAAKVVTVDEARRAQGLDSIGDDRGEQTIQELTDAAKTETAEINADAKEDAAKAAPTPTAPKPAAKPSAHAPSLRAGDFKEEDHPRQDDGKFGSGGGSGGGDADDPPKDDEDEDDSSDEKPSPEQVHEAVSDFVTEHKQQVELVTEARESRKAADKLGRTVDSQMRQAQKIDLPSNESLDVASALQDAEVAGTGRDDLGDRVAELYFNADGAGNRIALRTFSQAQDDAWRHLYAYQAHDEDESGERKDPSSFLSASDDMSIEDIKLALMTDADAKKVDKLIGDMNHTRNEQAKHINATVERLEAANSLNTEPGEDDWIAGAIEEAGFTKLSEDDLLDAVFGNRKLKPLDTEKVKKKTQKELDQMYE